MEKNNVIEVANLSKKFSKNIKSSKIQLKNIFLDTLVGSNKNAHLLKDEFYALDDISFNIGKNENVAIIGSNGSGKSTLLKILNGIYTPDLGEVKIKGKLGSVLELSSGFKSELSGRENIYLKFALQGIQKEEVDLIIDDVIAFSELENFMQTPLKHYSSGMKSKLGFAIVSSVNPDILILDEVFAAGDKKFREKSQKRIKELYKNSTMILVTHSMGIVKDIADRVLVLDKGKLVFDGNPQKGVAFYENMLKPTVIKQKVFSSNSYGVITAVYNAQDYLKDYFECLINQTLDFEKHIFLVLVDDGSTDDSAQIILAYQKQYPKNITYIKQEKSGVAVARNNGMQHIKTPWITFIDAIDRVNDIYFQEVDKCVVDEAIDMVSCEHLLLNQNSELKKNDLGHRFKALKKVVNPSNMQHFIETKVNSVFFKTILIKNTNLTFKTNIQSNFEDGYFVNEFMIENFYANIAYLQKPQYHERVLKIKVNQWDNPQTYLTVLEDGFLNLLKKSELLHANIPVTIQRYTLYYLQAYFKKIIDEKDELLILQDNERKEFKQIIKDIFSYLDSSVIEVCFLAGLSHKYRVGYYNLYKNKILYKQVCYIDNYNDTTKELELYYYYHTQDKEDFMLNDSNIKSSKSEIKKHNFLEDIFMFEKKIFIHLENKWSYFRVFIGSEEAEIIYNSKSYKNGIQLANIKKG